MEVKKRGRKKKEENNKYIPEENNKYIPDVIEFPVKMMIQSKTLWVNLIALGGFLLEQRYGFPISLELQAEVLVVINVILRIFTHKKLTIK